MRETNQEINTQLDSIWQKRLLVIIRIVMQRFACQDALMELDATRIMAIASDLRLRIWLVRILEMARSEKWNEEVVFDGCERLRNLALSKSKPQYSSLQVINNQPGLSEVLDSDFSHNLHEDTSATWSTFSQARSVLQSLLPQIADPHLANVQYIVGLNGPADEILAGSSPDFPGMVAFNVNTQPIITAEQVLHEAMHNSLVIKLEAESKYKELIFNLPAGYSLFVEKIRPFELILHGFLSYSAVFLLWDQLKKEKAEFLREANGYTIQFTNQRCHILQNRLRSAWKTLTSLTPTIFHETIYELIESLLCGGHEVLGFLSDNSAGHNPILGTNQIRVLGKHWHKKYSVCETEWAEFILAISGEKVSRISASLIRATKICRFLENNHIPYCVSNEVFIPNNDLVGFSNTYSQVFDLRYFEDEAGEVHIFISQSIDLAIRAFESDPEDMAGSYLQIPSCCCHFFLTHWEEALYKFNGDLFRKLLLTTKQKVTCLPWQTNIMALYRGSSLLFHFPCQLDCPATINLVNNRAQILRQVNSTQVDQIVSAHQAGFFLTKDGFYLETNNTEKLKFEKEIRICSNLD